MLFCQKGDLLKSDCTVIMHQANCFKTMGAGIAKQISIKYPLANKADKLYEASPEERFGKFTYAKIRENLVIINLYGQYGLGKGLQTNYEKLDSAIDSFLKFAKEKQTFNLNKIGVPYNMGCGLAGGDWEKVKEILIEKSNKYNVDIYVYQL